MKRNFRHFIGSVLALASHGTGKLHVNVLGGAWEARL